jgi:tetratricopeptide (TPR) repeat protein/tRNA A-37 threonylcarbamoyl transferase component Bud32
MAGLESLLTGRVLGDRYRIEEVIGRGGMGAVYRATDERLGRQVAVKVITVAGTGDAEARERLRQRFLREARAAAGLPHHPNVVPVYDFGTDPVLGLDFIVMELLRGEDLATYIARAGVPPIPLTMHILSEAARGVAVGHRSGLVHRDVKPGNIFLVEDSHGDVQVRVLDFGIAKLADDDTLTALTQDGRTPLSPAFASPEQLRGLSRITPASDVFSLGAIAFQLLTGERAFSDADRNRMSLGMAVPVPTIRELNPAVPPAIDEIVRRALAFDPEERLVDARELGAELDRARRELGDAPLPPYPGAAPGAARPAGAAPAARSEVDRTEFLDDRTLLDRSGPGAPDPVQPQPAARAATPLPPRRREPEPGGMGAFMLALVLVLLLGAGGVIAYWALTQDATPAAEVVPPPPDEVPPIVPDEPEVPETAPLALEGAIQNQEGFRLFRDGDYEGARVHFRRATELVPDSATYRYNYGLTLLRLGEVRPAVREFQRVLTQAPERAGAHFYLGEAQLALGDTSSAIASLESALIHATDARERTLTERRLREVRTAVLQPAPQPLPEPQVQPPPSPAEPPPPNIDQP